MMLVRDLVVTGLIVLAHLVWHYRRWRQAQQASQAAVNERFWRAIRDLSLDEACAVALTVAPGLRATQQRWPPWRCWTR